jgi:uncharacterized membrane protein
MPKKSVLIVLYLIFYYVLICAVTINRWRQYEVYYFDHGIFDQALWQVAHAQAPFIDHLESKPLLHLGDHFAPLYYLISPIYWLTEAYEPLFFVQNLFVVASAWVLFRIMRRHNFSLLSSFAILFAYTFFIGLQNTIIAGFHTELPALLVLSLVFDALDQKKYWLMSFYVSLLLLLKQLFVPIAMGIAVYVMIAQRKFKLGILIMAASLLYYSVITQIVMPWLAGRPYQYTSDLNLNLTTAQKLVNSPAKRQVIGTSLANFGGLPLVTPAFWPVILQDWVLRFVLQDGGARHDLGMHYNALLSVILAYSSIMGLQTLQRHKKTASFIPLVSVLIIGSTLYFHQITYRGPLGLGFNRAFYENSAHFGFLDSFVQQVPLDQGLIMAPNNIAVRLTHQAQVILLRSDYEIFDPSIIVLDIRDGQNPNNYWPLPPAQFSKLYHDLLKDGRYSQVAIAKEQIYFQKVKD